ncbi:Uncharacterized protein OS=Chloroflexus aurantiacus (strain ATCC 29364 / DSM 637 / Y-400-fl) GN=Chy400_1966 PE=4 SV=1: Uma2 [Gemmataceae bacterium]|nr:Uncharacterized protein OS=Chloroflexus aurantiacus (strain ATCC 29364 / DSM 637 / Y-400-fl) GN=Chy400_1966 PE=4 SV=1: Uma2 [Gemmataceae bacterium]VTT99989.1 Uncharacterized protein OS=Chloroflexus aurantiacus (strain ATCC 29364 / DSM 637 / Y-400-fl) GN=Chy400_1966 PE=4 SV=1: Uma2 [Gemmataceae bacterium]
MGSDAPQLLSRAPLAPVGDPYFYGWRMVPRWDGAGNNHWEKVPLTAWDVLHPEEDDFIVQTDAHDDDCHYLKGALKEVLAGRPGVNVFSDLRVDWQVPQLSVHGPDIVVFEGAKSRWVRERGTFPVKDMGARPLLVIEIVSPNTRDIDTVSKVIEYHRAGVPVYILVHRDESGGAPAVHTEAYRFEPAGYVPIPDDPRGVWVESVGLWVRGHGDRIACFDAHGVRIPERPELTRERNELRVRAEAEKARAEQEKQRADAEKARADEAARKLAELEAELKRLRGGDSN